MAQQLAPLFDRVPSLRSLYEPLVVRRHEDILGITDEDRARKARERDADEVIKLKYDRKRGNAAERELLLASLQGSASAPSLAEREVARGGRERRAAFEARLDDVGNDRERNYLRTSSSSSSSSRNLDGIGIGAQQQQQQQQQPAGRNGAPKTKPVLSKVMGSSTALGISPALVEQLPLEQGLLSDAVLDAGKAFNERHVTLSLGARRYLQSLVPPQPTMAAPDLTCQRFGNVVGEVQRNRLWLPEAYNPFAEPVAARRRRVKTKRWHLDLSIWYPRKLSGNSKDYYETDPALRDMFDADWYMIVAAHGLGKLMVELSTGDRGTSSELADLHAHKAVLQAKEALWQWRGLVYGLFDYYSIVFDTKKSAAGEREIHSMPLNAFIEFARDVVLVHRTPSLSTVELIWSTVTTVEKQTVARDPFKSKARVMSRHEFVQAIVRIAVEGYHRTGKAASVPAAIEQLCVAMSRSSPGEAQQDSNAFRRSRCYNEPVDTALRRHEVLLRAIFEVYSSQNTDLTDALQHKGMMSIGEFFAFIEHVGLLELNQLTSFGCKIVFKWSVIRAARNHEALSLIKSRNLHFEDFLEVLVRIACTVALPTDMELAESGAEDAGEFLLVLFSASEIEYERFIQRRRVSWDQEPKQMVARCITHLMTMILRVMQGKAHGRLEKKQLSANEVSAFALARRRG